MENWAIKTPTNKIMDAKPMLADLIKKISISIRNIKKKNCREGVSKINKGASKYGPHMT